MLLLASPCETDSSSTGGTRTEAGGCPRVWVRLKRLYPSTVMSPSWIRLKCHRSVASKWVVVLLCLCICWGQDRVKTVTRSSSEKRFPSPRHQCSMRSVTAHEKENKTIMVLPISLSLWAAAQPGSHILLERETYVPILILKFPGKISPSLMVELENHNKALNSSK